MPSISEKIVIENYIKKESVNSSDKCKWTDPTIKDVSLMSREALIYGYDLSIKSRNETLAKTFWYMGAIQDEFKFMDTSDLEQFIDNKRICDLTLVHPKLRNHSYDVILEIIFREKNVKKYKKRVGQLIIKKGTKELNNLYFLSKMIKVENILDQYISTQKDYRLSPYIANQNTEECRHLNSILHSLPFSLKLPLLESFNKEHFEQFKNCVDIIRKSKDSIYLNKLLKLIVKKFGDFESVTEALGYYVEAIKIESINNDIKHLNGTKFNEANIYVPLSIDELRLRVINYNNCLKKHLNYYCLRGVVFCIEYSSQLSFVAYAAKSWSKDNKWIIVEIDDNNSSIDSNSPKTKKLVYALESLLNMKTT